MYRWYVVSIERVNFTATYTNKIESLGAHVTL